MRHLKIWLRSLTALVPREAPEAQALQFDRTTDKRVTDATTAGEEASERAVCPVEEASCAVRT